MQENEKPQPQDVEDKKARQLQRLKSLTPKGQDPELYGGLIKTQIMGVDKEGKPRPNEDFMLFLYVAKKSQLDPLLKQIYAVYRWDSSLAREKMTIQVSIDGMRVIAQRTKQYAGQDDIEYLPKDESSKYPDKATCTVYKMIGSKKVSFTASARWSEYAQILRDGKVSGMWEKMPYLMLGKCAEALALRKAFPNELSGLYANEEMMSTSSVQELPVPEKFQKEEEPTEGVDVTNQPSENEEYQTEMFDKGERPDFGAMRDKNKSMESIL